MSGTTSQMIKRLTWLPNRDSGENGTLIAGQDYFDVEFTGGSISNVILTNVTFASAIPLSGGGTGANLSDPGSDRIMFWDESANAVTWLTAGSGLVITGTTISVGGGGLGDVVGPASSTDNAIARFDTTTGKIIQNSGATIDDSGNITATNLSGTNTGNQTTSGTSNRITVTNGSTNPVIDISSSYAGQSTITTTGTLTSGATGAGFTVALGTSTITGDLPFTNIAQLGANTVAANPTAGTADISTVALSASQLLGRGSTGNIAAITLGSGLTMTGTTMSSSLGTAITRQYLTSGSGATYTTPAGCRAILVKAWGGGGGGAAQNTNSGSSGGTTIFNSVNANGGGGGLVPAAAKGNTGGIGGSGGSGTATFRMRGNTGEGATNSPTGSVGGNGGASSLGGNGYGAVDVAGVSAVANSGSGGGGACAGGGFAAAAGGGAGEYFELYISSPSATYTYTIGSGGNGGAPGTLAGGNGGSGMIIVEEYY